MSKQCTHPTCGDECRRPKAEKKRTRPKPMSDKRTRELALYRKERKKFLQDNPECKAQIFPICDYQATEVHHMAGRENGLLLDQSLWLPICRNCHSFLTENSRQAIDMGLSISRHTKKSMIDSFVYTHSLDGVVFYVGSSRIRPPKEGYHTHWVKYQRAYAKSSARPKEWHEYVKGREDDVVIEIVKEFKTHEDAFKFETELIQTLGTIANGDGQLINKIQSKPCYQFDISGKFVCKHLSTQEASEKTGIDRGSINNAILGNRKSAGGFQWSYSETKEALVPDKFIVQKTLDGNPIRLFNTLQEAKKVVNTTSATAIRNCFTGKQKQAYGFQWAEITYREAIEMGLSVSRHKKAS